MHQFLPEQPDLNFRNNVVIKEMEEVMKFWLRKGVVGFRIDAAGYLMESDVNKRGFYDDEPLYPRTSSFNDPILNLNGLEPLKHIQ